MNTAFRLGAAWRAIQARSRILTAVAFMVATFALTAVQMTPDRAPVADETWYLNQAIDIRDGTREFFGISVMPVYPAYLQAVMAADREAVASARCMIARMAEPGPACANAYGTILWPQAILLSVAVGVGVWIVHRHLGGFWIALGSGLFMLGSGEPLLYANHYLTEAVSFPLFLLFTAAFLHAVRTRSVLACLAAGLLLGLLALTRASFLFAVFPAVLALALIRPDNAEARRRPVAAALVLGFALLLVPYFAKKYEVQGRWLPDSSTPILTVRLAYNDMTAREWLAGWIFWIPRVGDNLAAVLFRPEDVERLKFDGKDSFYTASWARLHAEAGRNGGQSWLVKEKILGDLPWHLAVSLLMAWRAGFIGGVWGAFGLLSIFLCAVRPGWAGGRFGTLVAITAVPLFTMGVQAFTAPPIERYNIFMLLPMGACLSLLAIRVTAVAGGRIQALRNGRHAS